jgi:hypothetical protein
MRERDYLVDLGVEGKDRSKMFPQTMRWKGVGWIFLIWGWTVGRLL